jgi:dephospho-CoA kinase
MILRVGLTGGIASGKSTVGILLRELGCFVFDADAIVRELYRPDEAGFEAVVSRYGDEVLSPAGEIDRAALARLAFATASSAAELNTLIHPLVIAREDELFEELRKEMKGSDAIAVVEATLLIEAGGRDRYDRIIVVDADPPTQLERAVKRGMKAPDARSRMERQMTREERLARADYLIENNTDLASLRSATESVYRQLLGDLERLKA